MIKSPTRTETVAVADIITLTDYYAFGMAMPGRTLCNSEHYRYGFNGMEKDDDWYGAGNEYTTEFRQLDIRTGRWMSMDPMMAVVPDRSPYEFVFNNPVSLTDPSGLFPGFGKGRKGGGDIPTRTPRYRHEDSGGSGAGASSGPSAIGGMLRSVADFVVSAAKFVNKNPAVLTTASNTLNDLSRRSTLPNDFPRYRGGTGYGLSIPPTGNGYKPSGFLGFLSSLNEPPKRSDFPDNWFGELLYRLAKLDYEMVISPGAGVLKVVGPGSKAISTASKIAQIGTKLEYVFGKATGNAHNIERSTAMLRQLESIGIFDNAAGRAYVHKHLENAYSTTMGIVQENGRVLRESLLMGPNGALKVESIWDDSRLITVKLIGGN